MNRIAIYLTFISATGLFSEPKEIIAAEESRPSYQVFYESGYYLETIDLLKEKVKIPNDSNWRAYHSYLAFSYLSIGDTGKAIEVFHQILAKDPAFSLDPIHISPKILEVFRIAQATRPKTAAPKVSIEIDPIPETAPFQWKKNALATMGTGIPQWVNGHPQKGAILAFLEITGLAVSIWSHHRRNDFYDEALGWYEGNLEQNKKYINIQRAGFAIFLGSYLYSTIDGWRAKPTVKKK